MATSSTFLLPGTRVRYTESNLGLIGDPGTVDADDLGTVIGPAPDEGWILTEPDAYPHTICPVFHTMIERIS